MLLKDLACVPSGVSVGDGCLRVTWPATALPGDGERQVGPPKGPAHTQTAVGAWVEQGHDTECGVFSAGFLKTSTSLAQQVALSTSNDAADCAPEPASPHQRVWQARDFAASAVAHEPVLPDFPAAQHARWEAVPSGSGEGVTGIFGSSPEQVACADDTALPSVPVGAMGSAGGLAEALACIHRYGFVAVTGVAREGTEELVRRISFPRPTLYSHSGMWRTEVRPDGNDTAYQSIPLPAHTDGTYFQDPPGLQVFHAVATAPSGGASMLVDGFAVARTLQAQDPAAFRFFAHTDLPFRFLDDEHFLLAWQRVFRLDSHGRLLRFAYNNDDRAPFGGASAGMDDPGQSFYRHLPSLLAAIRSAHAELWFQLTPGLALIFDNQRVLHARSGFSVAPGQGRVLEGAYVNEEDWKSKLRVLGAGAGWSGAAFV